MGSPLDGRSGGSLSRAHGNKTLSLSALVGGFSVHLFIYLLRRCSGPGLHLAMTGEPRGFSRVAAGFSSYDRAFRIPLVLAQGSPIFHSSCEGKLGIALE